MAVNVGSTTLWDMMPCSKAGKNEHFRGRYACLREPQVSLHSPHQPAFTFHCSCQLCDHHLIWHHELHHHSHIQIFFCFFSIKALYVWPFMTDAHSGLSINLVLLLFTPIFCNSNSTSSMHLNCSLLFSPSSWFAFSNCFTVFFINVLLIIYLNFSKWPTWCTIP